MRARARERTPKSPWNKSDSSAPLLFITECFTSAARHSRVIAKMIVDVRHGYLHPNEPQWAVQGGKKAPHLLYTQSHSDTSGNRLNGMKNKKKKKEKRRSNRSENRQDLIQRACRYLAMGHRDKYSSIERLASRDYRWYSLYHARHEFKWILRFAKRCHLSRSCERREPLI